MSVVYFKWIYLCCYVFVLFVFVYCGRLYFLNLILIIKKKYNLVFDWFVDKVREMFGRIGDG